MQRTSRHITGPPRDRAPTDGQGVLDALRTLQRELRLIDGRRTTDVGLPPAQARVLHELGRARAHSLAELARRTHTDPSSASVVVQRLVDAELVARVPAADDRRRTELSLTAAGRARVRRVATTDAQRLDDAVAALGRPRSATLVRTLQSLAALLRAPTPSRTAQHDDDEAGPSRA